MEHVPGVGLPVPTSTLPVATAGLPGSGGPLDVRAIHDAHADFVFATLQRFGVRDADLDDLMQEVFVVVHRRLDSFDGTSRMTTWLFGIAMRVAAGWRRRAHVRRERATDELPEDAEAHQREGALPADEALALMQARSQLEVILDGMDLERRAAFVMFEIEEMSCEEIAQIVGVPVGTVYSRLHKARKEFESALARLHARDAGEAAKRGVGR